MNWKPFGEPREMRPVTQPDHALLLELASGAVLLAWLAHSRWNNSLSLSQSAGTQRGSMQHFLVARFSLGSTCTSTSAHSSSWPWRAPSSPSPASRHPARRILRLRRRRRHLGIVLIGTAGSWFGSAVMYWLSRSRTRLHRRFGKYVMITEDKLERSEHWLHRYEAGGIFFARLLPVIRHLISIPAGIIRMNFDLFSAMTVAGSAIWCAVLAIYGKQVLGDLRRTKSKLDPGPRRRPGLHQVPIPRPRTRRPPPLRPLLRLHETHRQAPRHDRLIGHTASLSFFISGEAGQYFGIHHSEISIHHFP